jgi:hypothetical protein
MSVVGVLGLLEKLRSTAVKFPGERRCFATVDPRAKGIRVSNYSHERVRAYAFAFNQ